MYFVLPLLQLATLACASQIPFMRNELSSDGTTLRLSALSNEHFTVLEHPEFPSHSVRIKKSSSEFCDPSVASYTGWIDTSPARHLFFYFFESRGNPEKDDVIFWTNGGPGGSSALGLFMELGPCRMVDGNTTKVNPYSWNENANIFFIDQPIGVGFSYADYGESVSTTEEAAQDIVAFMTIFFETFSKFKGRGFHLAGESYAGRYLPVYAGAIYDHNKRLEASGVEPIINLQSVMIGNGYTDLATMIPSYYDVLCTPASVDPPFDIGACIKIKTALPRCQKWFKESCLDIFDVISCRAAVSFCSELTGGSMAASGLNPYDISKHCDDYEDTLCYPISNYITEYLNRPETREILGIPRELSNLTFSSINMELNHAFNAGLDQARVQTKFYLENLLHRGVRVLIYVGSYDGVCNWVGNNRMVDSLEWQGSASFAPQRLRPWSLIKGQEETSPSGLIKNTGNLTFLTIEAAGHMVPYDKPAESLEMVKRWLRREDF
ncbi:serine carboxypeptidase [Sistotremastrum niveocremeum HHB9708]|uniref:Carboxypeptidase n=1 Tax=Sistotremastrum niveocremeum HHB9708 TaxID=1314777 RepID=A0A164TJ59_9AGAM|nr:serine carboxypeptidase [Sistotremastrum niveocremeum HHB9708]